MLDSIKTGSSITVKVVKTPRRVAAAKTLVRLLSKDEAMIRENARLRALRKKHALPTKRGGRTWMVLVPKQRPVRGQAGESGTITATVDVLKDLRSVQRFIEVAAA
jgi:hypothetical protein